MSPQSNGKPALSQQSTLKKHVTLMISKREPAIWLCATYQQILCYLQKEKTLKKINEVFFSGVVFYL